MKKLLHFVAILTISLSALLSVAPKAFAATQTWDGGGGDANMTTGANWVGDVAPSAGDDLVFPAGALRRTINNDYTANTSFNSITFNGTSTSSNGSYTINGNAITVVAGITDSNSGTDYASATFGADITLPASQTLTVGSNNTVNFYGTLALGTSVLTTSGNGEIYFSTSSTITGSGNINKSGTGSFGQYGVASSYTGTIVASAGSVDVKATNIKVTANAGADVSLVGDCTADTTFTGDLSLTGASSSITGDFPVPKLQILRACYSGGGGYTESYGYSAGANSVTFSGILTLGSDVTFASEVKTTTLTGAINGSFTINMLSGYSGNLVLNSSANNSTKPNATYAPARFFKTLSDALASVDLGLSGNATITIDGVRGDTTVNDGAILKGVGTVGVLTVNTGGRLAPGHSPGCINSGGLVLAGTFEAEIGGTDPCTGYDQTNVTGTVNLTGGTLSVIRYNDFKPAKGQTYIIIKNDGSDAVTGTFKDLAEGSTVTVDGYVFKVSYIGGDGNDVTLTIQTTPGAPNTGFKLNTSNPMLTFGATTVLAGGMLLLAKRYAKSLAR